MPVTVVTGASGALGQVMVTHLLTCGHQVLALARNADSLAALARDPNCVTASIDPQDTGAWPEALRGLGDQFGAPTGAVLCAGGWAGGAALQETAPEVWRDMFAANLETAHSALRALLPGMVERQRGSIVAIGSRAAARPWESAGAGAYAASKAALVSLVQTCAAESLAHGVRLNALLPSTIDTPNNRRFMQGADTAAWVSPLELAHAATFLLSDAASGITGAAIPVYGRM